MPRPVCRRGAWPLKTPIDNAQHFNDFFLKKTILRDSHLSPVDPRGLFQLVGSRPRVQLPCLRHQRLLGLPPPALESLQRHPLVVVLEVGRVSRGGEHLGGGDASQLVEDEQPTFGNRNLNGS